MEKKPFFSKCLIPHIRVLLHSFVQKWLGWDFELKGVGDCSLVYGYFIFIEC